MVTQVLRRAAFSLTNRISVSLGYRLVRDGMYSPLPEIPSDDSPDWERKTSLPGIELDTRTQIEWLRETLAAYFAEFFPPEQRNTDGWRQYHGNGYYTTGDAEVLYAMLRHFKPRQVLEIGSGFSTMVGAMAAARNARDGVRERYVSADPEPRIDISSRLPFDVEHRACKAQVLPMDAYLSLGPGDFLLIDSTHTVKMGSDVNFLVLEVLPRLRRGVIVHFHDIFLPWGYPREWLTQGLYLAEQYLLQAFLAENQRYRVLLSMYALARNHCEQLQVLIPDYRPYYHGPSALWIERQ
jgi:hypothetical protein